MSNKKNKKFKKPFETLLEENFKTVIHTDGCCLVNPGGPGSYAAIIEVPETGYKIEISKAYGPTTNNRMEFRGVIGALVHVISENLPSPIVIFSDSQYVVNTFECGWANSWRSKDWKHADSDDGMRKNHDLVKRILDLMFERNVRFQWIKSHNGHPRNERCDELATWAVNNLEHTPDLKII